MKSTMIARRLGAALLVSTCLTGVAVDAHAQGIEEIVVTTRKRAENLQDVPIVITAFTAELMERKGIADIEDITKYTPGLSYDEGFSKQDTRIAIRGLSPSRGRQNAAILMDDVDISSEAIATAGGSLFVNPRLFDTERVEVVKGPHSALYGRSAFAGAINYIMRKPGDEFRANATFDIASRNKFEGRASVSGPVVADKLSIGGTVAVWDIAGMYRSTVSGARLGGTDGDGYALSAVWKPTEDLKFSIRGEHTSDHFDQEARGRLDPGPATTLQLPATAVGVGIPGITTAVTSTRLVIGRIPGVGGLTKIGPSRNPRTGEDYPGTDRELESVHLRTDLNLGPVELIGLTYYGSADATQLLDVFANGDSSVVNALQEINFITDNRVLNQDIRLQSTDEESPLNWAVGGLFWHELTRQESRSMSCIYIVGGCTTLLRNLSTERTPYLEAPNIYFRDTHHYSVYGLLEYDVTEAIGLAMEIRHTWENEKVTTGLPNTAIGCRNFARAVTPAGVVCAIPGPAGVVSNPVLTRFPNGSFYTSTKSESKFTTPRFTAEYQFTDDQLVYVSAGKGQKPGGVLSLLAPSATGDFSLTKFKEEILWVYELGIKSEWLDGRARVNADVYWQDFKNKQETGTRIGNDGVPVPGPGNAEKVRVKGFELDGAVAFTENLTASLGYSYIDGKYVRFNIVQTAATNIALAGNCTVVRPATGTPFCNVDYSGRSLVLAPKHSGNLSVGWTQPFSDVVDFFVETDGRYMSKRFLQFDNQTTLGSYAIVDARLGVRSEKWSITGYVNNVFNNKQITAVGFTSPNFNISLLPPAVPGFLNSFLTNLPDRKQFGMRLSYTY
ncbi:MAG: TonB-dependent receptor [Rhodospirillaceae bacterium]|nr:TonB-dependent receptor [Rhodospirillaceae bacterium]